MYALLNRLSIAPKESKKSKKSVRFAKKVEVVEIPPEGKSLPTPPREELSKRLLQKRANMATKNVRFADGVQVIEIDLRSPPATPCNHVFCKAVCRGQSSTAPYGDGNGISSGQYPHINRQRRSSEPPTPMPYRPHNSNHNGHETQNLMLTSRDGAYPRSSPYSNGMRSADPLRSHPSTAEFDRPRLARTESKPLISDGHGEFRVDSDDTVIGKGFAFPRSGRVEVHPARDRRNSWHGNSLGASTFDDRDAYNRRVKAECARTLAMPTRTAHRRSSLFPIPRPANDAMQATYSYFGDLMRRKAPPPSSGKDKKNDKDTITALAAARAATRSNPFAALPTPVAAAPPTNPYPSRPLTPIIPPSTPSTSQQASVPELHDLDVPSTWLDEDEESDDDSFDGFWAALPLSRDDDMEPVRELPKSQYGKKTETEEMSEEMRVSLCDVEMAMDEMGWGRLEACRQEL